ncbi:MAG: type II secretion system GspH family protein [Kiritimatiellaeota bacterium]|nr:type II secretion system GspH family protein [Kiritimatiellota bacterium]
MIELLVVICIIGILGAALTTSIRIGMKNACQTDCKSKLRQLGIALAIYRSEHDNRVPDWLSNLYPEYADDLSLYVCFADGSSPKGSDAPVPPAYLTRISDQGNFYTRTGSWDNERGTGPTRTLAVRYCSYCYEFSAAEGTAGWYKGSPLPEHEQDYRTMGQYKRIQMLYGGRDNTSIDGVQLPYPASQIPIVRCCHHWKDQSIPGVRGEGQTRIERMPIVLNVAYAGNVFASTPYWEGMSRLGNSNR